jgi:hypothetical protein
MRSFGVVLWVVATGALTVVSACASSAGSDRGPESSRQITGETIKHPDFVGRTEGEPKKSVLMAITAENGADRPEEGLFQPKQVTIICEQTDEQEVVPVSPLPIYFDADGAAFIGGSYRHTGLGDELTVLIRGHLSSNGRKAKGTVVVQGHTNGTYCSSTAKVWSAKRVTN